MDDKVPTPDLNGAVLAGNDTTTINSADLVSFGSSTAILPNVAAVTDADVLKIILDFADTAAANAPKSGDHLKIGTINGSAEFFDLTSTVNLGNTTGNLTLGGQSGLDYSYDHATHQLTLFKHDGSTFAASNIDGVLKAMQFMGRLSPYPCARWCEGSTQSNTSPLWRPPSQQPQPAAAAAALFAGLGYFAQSASQFPTHLQDATEPFTKPASW
ncbi:MAG: hypothetical protein ORN29_10015 [Rhodoferax sp.]|nr:hypothetical protein [Rhodoferax sp.]